MTLHRLFRVAATTAALAGSLAVQAAPVTSSFTGQVSGYMFGLLDPSAVAMDEDAPVGTGVSWQLSYDDSFLALPWNEVFSQGSQAITGSLRVGNRSYSLETMGFFSLTLDGSTWDITGYRAQIGGTGPGTSDGGDFFSMFFSFDPSLSMSGGPVIGYGYSIGWGTMYGYLETTGEYTLERGGSVPEPSTALLALPALAWLARRRPGLPARRCR